MKLDIVVLNLNNTAALHKQLGFACWLRHVNITNIDPKVPIIYVMDL